MKKMLFVLVVLVMALGIATRVQADAVPTVWTDKADYSPGETVIITGNGFKANAELMVRVTRPDNSVVTGDGSGTPGSDIVTTDSDGSFIYYYILDGIEGLYTVEVLRGNNVLATTTFTDCKPLFTSTISPDIGLTYQTQLYAITITNDDSNPSGNKLGSAIVTIPSGFTSVSITNLTTSTGQNWAGAADSVEIKLTAAASQERLSPGQSVMVTFSAKAPGDVGIYEWITTAYVNPYWSGDTFSLKEEQPAVTVNGVPTADVKFDQSGVSNDLTGTILTIDGTGYSFVDFPITITKDVGASISFAYQSPLVVDTGKQYMWTSTTGLSTEQNGTITVPSEGGWVTGSYVTQYKVTFTQSGLDNTATGTVVTVDGSAKAYADLPFTTGWLDDGTSLSFNYSGPVASSTADKQFRLDSVDHTTPLSVTEPMTVTGNYNTQYYLTMLTSHGTVSPGSGWHDAGTSFDIEAIAPTAGSGERYVWNGWTGDGTGNYTGMDNPATDAVTMNSAVTETASWTHQYRLTVAANFGTTSPSIGDQWYDAGMVLTISATAPTAGSGEKYVWNGWTGDGTGNYTGMDNPATDAVTLNSAVTETASWTHQVPPPPAGGGIYIPPPEPTVAPTPAPTPMPTPELTPILAPPEAAVSWGMIGGLSGGGYAPLITSTTETVTPIPTPEVTATPKATVSPTPTPVPAVVSAPWSMIGAIIGAALLLGLFFFFLMRRKGGVEPGEEAK